MIAILDHEKFRHELKKQNWKEEAFAELVGISDRHVRNLKKKDTNVTIALYYKIVQAFSLPMGALLVLYVEDD